MYAQPYLTWKIGEHRALDKNEVGKPCPRVVVGAEDLAAAARESPGEKKRPHLLEEAGAHRRAARAALEQKHERCGPRVG